MNARPQVSRLALAALTSSLWIACSPPAGGSDAGSDGAAALACRSDRECSAGGQVCDRTRGRCVTCVRDSDCGDGLVCARNECGAPRTCSSSRMCPGQVCDATRGLCVDCVEDVDCGEAERCAANRCVPRPQSCSSDRECSALGRVCDESRGVCVECRTDRDCVEGTFCSVDALCQAALCAPNSVRCLDATHVRACNATGSGYVDMACVDGQLCVDGRCGAALPDAALADARDATVDGPAPRDEGVVEASPVDVAVVRCASNEECSNGRYCDGLELCRHGDAAADARGCVAPLFAPCAPPSVCIEAERRCQEPLPTCSGSMADCDGLMSTGCETNVTTSVLHCGACGSACRGLGVRCIAGRCDRVASIHSYLYETCALREGGAVVCWGAARTDQHVVAGLEGAVEVVVGSFSYCARLASGAVRCWGSNDAGQLGNGMMSASTSPPVDVTGLRDATQLTGGEDFFCALRRDATVLCWGMGARGQLGNGSFASALTPVPVMGVADAVQIAAGRYHVCARTRAGRVYCWGDNGYQQLGAPDGSTTNRATAIASSFTGSALEIAVGNYTTYARTASALYAWGYNANGQVGDGTTTLATSPRLVSSIGASARSIIAGSLHACALLNDGTARCWGANADGQLGDGTMLPHAVPALFVAPPGIVQMSAGLVQTCARYEDGAVRCWGRTDTAMSEVPMLR